MTRAWSLLVLLAVTGGTWLFCAWPRRLDVNLSAPSSEYQTRAGAHAITFRVNRLRPSGDDGPVEIQVFVNAQKTAVIASSFSYDTWTDKPAGTYRFAWLDRDLWPDVHLENSLGNERYYVGSSDGKLHPLP